MSVELQSSVPHRSSHPPLRRISKRSSFSGQLDSGHLLFGREPAPLESHDSCYSSCSEESHSSLSREPSDTLTNECVCQFPSSSSPPTTTGNEKYVGFATKLGYTEEQLYKVLDKLGENAGQDQVLSELIKLGRTCPDAISQSPTETMNVHPLLALRSIVIDGSNIAMTHGRKEVFSCSGIKECVQFFRKRGHTDILVFVPQFRREAARSDCPITDQHILNELDKEEVLVWTPSRHIGGRRIVCHDDRYILKTAEEKDAVIVSNDEYRDLIKENPQYRKLVEQRLLMYSFVDGKFMPPDDPLGRRGPKLSQFLSKTPQTPSAQLCPYGRKCTYGNKCKYFHPERPNGIHVSVTERLMKGKQAVKQCVSARSPTTVESNLKKKNLHEAVSRTRSFNVLFSESLPQNFMQKCRVSGLRCCVQKEQLQAEDVPCIHQEELSLLMPQRTWRHATLNRNLSAPVRRSPPPVRVPFLREKSIDFSGQCSSISDFPQHQFPISRQMFPPSFESNNDPYLTDYMPPLSSSRVPHFFAPSTTVWGDPEYGVGPLARTSFRPISSVDNEARMRCYSILKQVFPESHVSAVMETYPEETDSQKLCALILEHQKYFLS